MALPPTVAPERCAQPTVAQMPSGCAVVVVNFASSHLLERNLAPLSHDHPELMVVVVDNWSSDAERGRVASLAHAQGWHLVGQANVGFGAGVNAGVERARVLGSRSYLVLNPDATLRDVDACRLFTTVTQDPWVLVAPQVLRPDGSVWSAEVDLHLDDGRVRSRRRRPPGAATAPWVSGACFAVSDQMWRAVGGFDPSYFLYWEDVDLSWRVARAGGRLVVDHDAVAVHDEGGTQRDGNTLTAKSDLYYYYNVRNRLLFARRHLGRADLWRWVLLTGPVAWEVVLHGERRRLLRSRAPLWAAARGARDGLLACVGRRRRTLGAPHDASPPAFGEGGEEELQVVVAVCTYRRPADLAEVLPHLTEQARRASGADTRVRLVVVDNDPHGGARDAVVALAELHGPRSPHPLDVRYVHEPAPGIAAARNRALDAASDADLLVFIDDDERPGPQWLAHLLQTWRHARCAAVVGPVVSSFTVPLDPWIAAGGFFERRRLPTGTPVDVAATNNLLLDLRVVRSAGLRFDEAFGITGGEDTHFTRRLHATGGRLVWDDRAGVQDVVPPARATRSWVVRRAFSSGNSAALVAVALARPSRRPLARADVLTRGAARLGAGAVRVLVGALAGPRRGLALRARGVRTATRGAGMVTGALGASYAEYARAPRRAATASR